MSDQSGGPDWWQASDYKWYPPQPPAVDPPVAMPVTKAQAISGAESLQPPPGFGLVPGGSDVRPLRHDNGFVHFLRYLLIGIIMSLLISVFFLGLVWFAFALAQTGRRKRDVLMYFIPIWGIVVWVQTIWRYTAKDIYWSARADRPSNSLFLAA